MVRSLSVSGSRLWCDRNDCSLCHDEAMSPVMGERESTSVFSRGAFSISKIVKCLHTLVSCL